MVQTNESSASNYVAIDASLLRLGIALPVDLFVYLSRNKSIVHFRQKGDQLAESDLQAFSKIPRGTLLIKRSERGLLLQHQGKELGDSLKSGKLDSEQAKASAAGMLQSLAVEGEAQKGGLEDLALGVEKMLGDLSQYRGKIPSLQTYEKVLSQFKSTADRLTDHERQVSAMASLMLITVGSPSMDDLSDVAAAGLVHDEGLRDGPKAILEKYLAGETESFNSSEKLAYMRHPSLTYQSMQKQKFKCTPGIEKILECHHENVDGSGFRSLAGPKIYYPAKIFRVADEAVVRLNVRQTTGLSILVILAEFSQENQTSLKYDQKILDDLMTRLEVG